MRWNVAEMRQVGGGFNRRIFTPIPVSSTGPSLAFPIQVGRAFWVARPVAHRGENSTDVRWNQEGLGGPTGLSHTTPRSLALTRIRYVFSRLCASLGDTRVPSGTRLRCLGAVFLASGVRVRVIWGEKLVCGGLGRRYVLADHRHLFFRSKRSHVHYSTLVP